MSTTDNHDANGDWQARKNAAIARGQANLHSIFIDRAQGAELWDANGRRYIDFGAGIAVCNTGHLHPKVAAAARRQLDRFSHTCFTVTPYDVAVELAERLNALVPGATPKRSMFVTTGAEAVENAVKIARVATGRRGVIAFSGGFHGRTLLTMALTGKVAPYKRGFGPFPAEIFHVPYPVPFHGVSERDSLAALETLFRSDIAPEDVAAMIVEPVQGEGGFYPAPASWLRALRALCDQHGIVMVVDEIQTGFARTGRMFCSEYAGIEADLMTLAKGIAGGFPLAAVVGKAELMDAAAPGGLGGTYAAPPLSCAAALAVLEVIEEEKLVAAAQRIGAQFEQRLSQLQARHPRVIGERRCERGAMLALELVEDGGAPAPQLAARLVQDAARRGLIILSCGTYGNVIRFLPPLVASAALVEEGLDILEQCFAELADAAGSGAKAASAA
jgi:4-aminobutyrate aminotransferase/(S)-3-amino-2-methylpropionate transaminase